MGYQRVLPRDLFNEAKLLKCVGRLSLLLHDYPNRWPLRLVHRRSRYGFIIDQNPDDGGLFVTNLDLMHTGSKTRIPLHSKYNSKDNYPLEYTSADGEKCGMVFDEHGLFTTEFLRQIGGNGGCVSVYEPDAFSNGG